MRSGRSLRDQGRDVPATLGGVFPDGFLPLGRGMMGSAGSTFIGLQLSAPVLFQISA